jgi:hypothetical protein
MAVRFTQRRFNDVGAGSGGDGTAGAGRLMHHTLFHPIAGDSLSHMPAETMIGGGRPFSMRALRFGILDAGTIERMSVVVVTSPLTNDTKGSLSDLRMGAGADRNQACETCSQFHNNCPGHFGRIVLPHPVINPLFVNLLANVLQTMCLNCNGLRVSPFYILVTFPGHAATGVRQLQRLKAISTFCARRSHCQFCLAPTLVFKQTGICITATATVGFSPTILMPAATLFTALWRLPYIDLFALGFTDPMSHPCNAVLSQLPVLPPVSRPSTRNPAGDPSGRGASPRWDRRRRTTIRAACSSSTTPSPPCTRPSSTRPPSSAPPATRTFSG